MINLLDTLADNLEYNDWTAVIGWFMIFAAFLIFLPFNKKSNIKPTGVYVAFIVASAFEMFGIPLSMYFVAWAFGIALPQGILWGHTMQGLFGYLSMYTGFSMNIIGGILIILGWRAVYKNYWSQNEGDKRLVTTGLYALSRHPQYLGFILMTLGLIIHWATLPLILMWPILVYQYYRLSKKEEAEMEREFGQEYIEYKKKTPMFLNFKFL
jgi:protein-S-isoprenylcysteine O-methyltransferase Ste14